MKEKRYPLTIVLMWVTIIFTAFLGENVALLSNDPRHGFQLRMFVLITVMTLAFSIMYIILEMKKNKNRIDYIVLIGVIIFFAINAGVIIFQPMHQEISGKYGTVSVDFTIKDKVIYILQLFLMMVLFYVFFGPFKKRPYALRVQNWMYWGHIITVVITFIFSIFLDYKEYQLFFSEGGEDLVHGIKSFYTNPNLYGTTMMFGVLTVMIMQIKKHRIYNTALMIFFILAGIFSACETTVFISIFVFVCYYTFDALYSFKKSPTLTSVRIIYALMLTLVFTMLTIILYDLKVVFIETPVNFFLKRFIHSDDGSFMSFRSRLPVWDSEIKIITSSPAALFFGSGYNLGTRLGSASITANYGWNIGLPDYYVMNSHSALFEILVRFGILGLTIYVGLMIDFFASIIFLFKKKMTRYAYVFLLCFLAILTHGVTEATMFFDITTKGITITIFFFVPVISQRRMFMSEGMRDSIPYRRFNEHTQLTFNTIMKVIFNVLSMVLLGALSLLFAKETYKDSHIIYVSIVIGSLLLLIFLGVVIDKIVSKSSFIECFIKDMKYTFVNNLMVMIVTLIIGAFIALMMSFVMINSLLTQVMIILLVSSVYFTLWLVIKNDENHLTINYLNKYMLTRISTSL